jgi:uncharacterized protein (DUF1330 family)
MPLTLCVLLTAVAGRERDLVDYEDRVLALLPAHGGRLLLRVRRREGETGPYEVHVIEFASRAALDGYLADPDRAALSELRDAVIARTELVPVDVVAPATGPPPRG